MRVYDSCMAAAKARGLPQRPGKDPAICMHVSTYLGTHVHVLYVCV